MSLHLTRLAEAAVWTCFSLTAFTYAGYPIVIWLAARLFGRKPIAPSPVRWPSVSLLIAAYNEQEFIGHKLANAEAAVYPDELLEVVVGSDGSTDGTNDIVSARATARIRLAAYAERRGKIQVLNETIRSLRGEIIVFSDANTYFAPEAVANLARWFADPNVLAVCGRLVLNDPRTGKNVDSLYWRYETFMKKCESRLGALLGANGAIYAMRRDRFVPPPANTIVDDFVIPLLAKIRYGGEIVYDADAVAYEETPASVSAEFRRRTRIGTGGYQSIAALWKLLNPARGWIAFAFFGHKVLRWSVPFFLVAMLIANATLLHQPPYRILMAVQLAFYGVSLLSFRLQSQNLPSRLLRVAGMFTTMNLALLLGFFRWLGTNPAATWERTAR